MKTISDLPDDLLGEIFYRVPITSLIALRSTCKRWNDLSKTLVFGKKAASNQQFLGFMLVNHKVCSLRFSLQGIRKNDELFVDPSVKKIHELEDVLVTRISQCDGLLLCVTKDNSCLVWNPYLGQKRWIQCTKNNLMRNNSYYALGYDGNSNNRNHKILRFLYDEATKYQIEVFDFSSNAWRALDVNPDWEEPIYHTGASLKGNTYFVGAKVTHIEDQHLLCFDFTAERFGPRIPLPFQPLYHDFYTVSLSCLRDEKLVVLYHHSSKGIQIWVSTKIDPNAVSWSMLFKVDKKNLSHFRTYFGCSTRFYIDEEKKVIVLFNQRVYLRAKERAFIIGEDGLIKYVTIGDALINHWDYSNLLSSSYVPSLVQLKINRP